MTEATLIINKPAGLHAGAPVRPSLDSGFNARSALVFFSILGLRTLLHRLQPLRGRHRERHARRPHGLPFLLLGVALFIALGFEFVNGFHDTANAVATVIYTHSMPATSAVVWSGFFNFLGVLASSGAVAYGIIALLPVELILQVGSSAGFAMVFALLIGAIIWNLGTWYLGLPASSSHTLIGSIIGVGLANQLMARRAARAASTGRRRRRSATRCCCRRSSASRRRPAAARPQAGRQEPRTLQRAERHGAAALVDPRHPDPDLHRRQLRARLERRPEGHGPDHADSDRRRPDRLRAQPRDAGQRHAAVPRDIHVRRADAGPLQRRRAPRPSPRGVINDYLRTPPVDPGRAAGARAAVARAFARRSSSTGRCAGCPAKAVQNVRNDMYLASETIRRLGTEPPLTFAKADADLLKVYRAELDGATRFIPVWVKVAVAIALGLGTMVGWKRIVITVGEKIGKSHLTYAQGASAELVAATTIAAADVFGLPVSTTQVCRRASPGRWPPAARDCSGPLCATC